MEGFISYKKCCHCKNEKPLTCFYKNKSLKDGLHLVCKSCKTEYYLKNKEKLFPKMWCSCGKTIYKYYLQKHLKTRYHHNLDNLNHSTEIETIT
jgi:hypothetical protein